MRVTLSGAVWRQPQKGLHFDERENIHTPGKILIARQYLRDHELSESPTAPFLQVKDTSAP